MTKKEKIEEVEKEGVYCKVRIDKAGTITGYLVTEEYIYRALTNTGGRRYIGDFLRKLI